MPRQAVVDVLSCARGKPWLPAVASNGNTNLFNPKRKINMKTPIPVSANIAYAPSAHILSAQEKSAPAKPAMSMGTDRQRSRMKENMKEMQQQMK